VVTLGKSPCGDGEGRIEKGREHKTQARSAVGCVRSKKAQKPFDGSNCRGEEVDRGKKILEKAEEKL